MPSGKMFEMKFVLGAQTNSGFKSTFSQAQAEFARLGNEIQSLNRVQGDITAYQKQAAAVDSAKAKIANLTKQHELLSQQIQNTAGDTSGLEMEQLKLEQRMASAQGALERQQGKLSATSQRLKEAGVNTADLAGESAKLTNQIEELSKEQEQAAQSAQEYGDSAASAFQAAGEALASAGLAMGLKQLGEAYLGTVQAAGAFAGEMSNVQALSGASSQEMAALRAQAKELGADTQFTARQSGEAMGYMGMAGWNAQQMLAGMPGVIDLAAASGEDLAGVADIVTDSLTGFGLTAADTSEFVDVLAAASSKSNTNVAMLGESFKYVAPLAGTLGYSAQDAAVMLGLMANSGIKASQAGTTLRTALTNLSSPTKEQAAEMERLGVRMTDSSGQMLPLLDLTENLRGAFSGMSEAQQAAAASTLFGKEAMSGMLAIINAGEADYQNLTQSIYNSAGAAERMANIKLDNLAGDLTLLQSAWDGLGITIGEEFMPQARGLVQAGTGVLGWVNQLVEDNPALVQAILAGAGAVGVLTTGIVALNAAKKAAAAVNLAAMFTGPVGPILAVGAALGAVAGGVIAFVNAANEGIPKVDELTQAAQSAGEAMGTVAADFDSSRVNIAATADVAGMYIDRLDQLGAKTSLTSAESTEYHNILQLLCDTVPDLAESIDLATDSIEGGTDALRAQTEAWQENAEAQAFQEAYSNLMGEYNAVLVEAAENSLRLTEAQNKLRAMEEERTDILRQMQEMEADPSLYDGEKYYHLEQRILALNNELMDGYKVVDAYQEAVDKSNAAADEARAATEGYAQAMADLTGESDNAAGAVDNITASVLAMSDSLVNEATVGILEAGASMARSVGILSQEYSETYSAAYDSISGQMGLFEAMKVEVETSVGDMIASLESQAAYMASYSENLRAAAEMDLSEGLLAQLSDGSTESAAYLQAIVDGGQEKIRELNDAFETVADGKDEFSRTIAQMQTDFGNEMDNMARDAAGAVAEMDLHNEAYAAGLSTMQGYLNAVNGMRGEIAAAAGNVGWGVVNAMNGALLAARSVKIPGHAAGTDSADPGLALVGEQGPELVVFRGGETVLNARETAAVRRSAVAATPALPAPNGGGMTITVAPVYQFSGGASRAQVEDVLQKNNAGLRELVLDVLRQIRAEEARRIFA